MRIWQRPLTVEELNTRHPDTLIRHVGIVFTEVGDDFVCATLPVDARTHQPMGLLHGGASVVLAETLGSVGANMCLPSAELACVGQEINANHVRSVRDGLVKGTARAAHIGGRSHVWTIDIRNADEELVCIARLTLAVVKLGPPDGISR